MKKSVKAYLLTRFKGLEWDKYGPDEKVDPLASWPDLVACVTAYLDLHPEIKQHARPGSAGFDASERFRQALQRYCTTRGLKLKLIDVLTKLVYRIPCSGLCEKPIRERPGLWHVYVSASWRLFYRKQGGRILFEEFGPHKKASYHRRS